MRIVYMLTSLGVGGTERQVLALGSRMAAKGHAVTVIVLRAAQSNDIQTDLKVIHLDVIKSPVGLFNGLIRGAKALRSLRPDIVHSHNFHGNMLARLLRRFCAIPALVSTIHNVYEGGWLRMLAYRLTDRFATMTTAVSAAAAERFVRLKSVAQSRCVVITNGIDITQFASDETRRKAVRAQMAVANEFVWLALGRMAPAKDYPNLLRAFALIRESQPNAQLWIAGAGQAGSRPQMDGFVAEVNCREHVFWLGLREDIPALLDASDAFVLASAWEGMPLALGEAMAMEKPLAATDVGGVRELAGDAGVLVPSRDPGRLAQAMLDVMRQSPQARRSTGKKARARVSSLFSMDAKAEEWEALYRAVLKVSD